MASARLKALTVAHDKIANSPQLHGKVVAA
jgi:hypothetical protein